MTESNEGAKLSDYMPDDDLPGERVRRDDGDAEPPADDADDAAGEVDGGDPADDEGDGGDLAESPTAAPDDEAPA